MRTTKWSGWWRGSRRRAAWPRRSEARQWRTPAIGRCRGYPEPRTREPATASQLVGIVRQAGFDRLFGFVGANELLEDVGKLVGHAGGLVNADGFGRGGGDVGTPDGGGVADAGLRGVVQEDERGGSADIGAFARAMPTMAARRSVRRRAPDRGRRRTASRRGSWWVVPLVKPLKNRLRDLWLAQGQPTKGKVCPPRQYAPSGMLDLGYIQERVHREWRALGLEPIGLHESRHTAATWLDHAGVSPKVASTLMGHKTPEYQPGAASITLRRYTHTLPGALERARDLLDRFLVERTRERRRARK